MRRKNPGKAAVCAALLLCGWLAACVPEPLPAGAAGQSVQGGWTLLPQGGCRAGVAIGTDGVFSYALRQEVAGLGYVLRSGARYAGDAVTDGNGALRLALSQADAPPPGALAYCRQWAATTTVALPFDAVAAANGFDPAALSFRAVTAAGLGHLAVGHDPARGDRFALHLSPGGLLRGFVLEDPANPGVALFHRDRVRLLPNVPDQPLIPVTNLPEQRYRGDFSAIPPEQAGATLHKLALNVNSAVEVTFSAMPGAGVPACRFVLYETASFVTASSTSPLQPDVESQTVAFNPGSGDASYIAADFEADGTTETAYLLPIAVKAPDGGACSAGIRARPLVAGLVERALAGGEAPAFALTLPGGRAFVAGHHPSAPGRLLAVPLGGVAEIARGWRLAPWLVIPAGYGHAGADVLGLGSGGATVRLTLTGQGPQRFLNVHAEGRGDVGLGPFGEYRPPPEARTLLLPASLDEVVPPEATTRWYRFALEFPERIGLRSEGGLDTRGRLLDWAGLPLEEDEDGAADGAGFQLVRSLAPGTYLLRVDAAAPGSFRLVVETAGAPPPLVADENLEACLLAAGANHPGTAIRRAVCSGRGIRSLEGLQAFPGLVELSLAGNAIEDGAPLTGMVELQSLSLAGNPVAGLDFLATLPLLHRLSLADTWLDGASLTVLGGLGDRLGLLDLAGARGLDEAGVQALKALLPATTLIAPDGTVLE